MKKNAWLFIFALALAADLLGIAFAVPVLVYIGKPAIVPALAAYFLTVTATVAHTLKKWIVLALLFSWLGDVLLMLPGDEQRYFILGLSAFLIAHIFYIVFFHFIRLREGIRSSLAALVIVAVYYTALITFLSPWLGELKLPVRIYGVVISFMCLLAIHLLKLSDRTTGRWLLTGALLFVFSDSILAISKFYRSWPGAGLAIMISYSFAQLYLCAGAARYLQQASKS